MSQPGLQKIRVNETTISLAPEDQARADLYALSARLLLAPPDQELLDSLASADALVSEQQANRLDIAWEKLVCAASLMEVDAVRDEYDALFVSIATPKINPYASLYLSGFMMEKPLAVLRADLGRLGLTRMQGSGETEDHLGALCETMRILIGGAPGVPHQSLEWQKEFFEKHIACWYERCLNDIASAEEAVFYRCTAHFIQAFLDVEAQAYAMEGDCFP